MDLDNITAENMKKLATKDSENIKKFLTQIKAEAEKGKTSLYISDYSIEYTTKKELERRGFKVQLGSCYNTVVMWD